MARRCGKDGDACAEWSIRTASGRQELYYRST